VKRAEAVQFAGAAWIVISLQLCFFKDIALSYRAFLLPRHSFQLAKNACPEASTSFDRLISARCIDRL